MNGLYTPTHFNVIHTQVDTSPEVVTEDAAYILSPNTRNTSEKMRDERIERKKRATLMGCESC